MPSRDPRASHERIADFRFLSKPFEIGRNDGDLQAQAPRYRRTILRSDRRNVSGSQETTARHT